MVKVSLTVSTSTTSITLNEAQTAIAIASAPPLRLFLAGALGGVVEAPVSMDILVGNGSYEEEVGKTGESKLGEAGQNDFHVFRRFFVFILKIR